MVASRLSWHRRQTQPEWCSLPRRTSRLATLFYPRGPRISTRLTRSEGDQVVQYGDESYVDAQKKAIDMCSRALQSTRKQRQEESSASGTLQKRSQISH